MIEVSVIVPTYNRRELLKRNLESLFNQSYPADMYEIIVVDDGSKDGTEEMVKGLMENPLSKLRYFKQENKGPAVARNFGVKNAKGKICAFIDSDAFADINWIKELMQIYTKEEIEINDLAISQHRIGGVGGRILIANPESKVALYSEYGRYALCEPQQSTAFSLGSPHGNPTSNVSYKKEVLEEVGLFNETTFGYQGEDTELGLRVTNHGYLHIYTPYAVVYHKHPEKISRLMKMWFTIGKQEVILSRKDSKHKINSPFRLPSRKFIIHYWYLIPIDILVRISIIFGIIAGCLSKPSL